MVQKVIILLSLVLFVGCSEAENTAVDQRTAIVKHLDATKLPYEQVQVGVYKQTISVDPNQEEVTPIAKGDLVDFWFAIYEFSSTVGGIYYTNVSGLIPEDSNLNETYWSFEPQQVKVGKSSLLGGVQQGLIGSRPGDSVMVYLTAEKAYGDNQVGVVPPNMSVVFALKINEVSK